MQQLRALPAGEASTLFRVPHGMDVVSLPSSGSEGHPRDSSEDNWSVVDERPGSDAASPPAAAAAKDASPPSESSEPVTVVAAVADWEGAGWDDWGVVEAGAGDLSPSAPPAEEDAGSTATPCLPPTAADEGSTAVAAAAACPPTAEVSLTMTAGDAWGWSAGEDEEEPDEQAAAGLPSGQWGWDEDAGWPRDDQPPSEALRLGNTELVTQHVLDRDETAPPPPAAELSAELSDVRELLLTTQMEVSALAEERARLLQQLEAGGAEEPAPADAEAAEADQAAAEETAARLEEALAEVESLRHQLFAAESERDAADRSVDGQRVDAGHQWSVLNLEISTLKTDLDSTVADLAELRAKLDAAEAEKAECHQRFVFSQQEADRLSQETHALRASRLETEQERRGWERRAQEAELASAVAVALAERTLAELRAAAAAVERLEQEVATVRAESEAAAQHAAATVERCEQDVAAARAETEAAAQNAAAAVEKCERETAAVRAESEAADQKVVHAVPQASVSSWEDAIVPSAVSTETQAAGADLVVPQYAEHVSEALPAAGSGYQQQQDGFIKQEVADNFAVQSSGAPVSHSADQDQQHAGYFGSEQPQTVSYFGQDQQAGFVPMQPGGYFSPESQQTAGYFGQDNQQTGGYFGQDNQQTGGYFDQNSQQTGTYFDQNDRQTGAYFNQDNQQTGGYFGQESQQTGSYFGQDQQHAATYFDQSRPQAAAYFGETPPHPQHAQHNAPSLPQEPALSSVAAPPMADQQPEMVVSAAFQQPNAAHPPLAGAAPVPVFSMFGGAVPADPFAEVWPAAAGAAPAEGAAATGASQAAVPDAPTENPTAEPSGEEPGPTRSEREELQERLESALRERQELQERLQALEPSADHQERLESALRERSKLQERLQTLEPSADHHERLDSALRERNELHERLQALEPSADHQERLESALRERNELHERLQALEPTADHQERLDSALKERDELRLRVQDLELAGEQLREAVLERDQVEAELLGARRQLETARRGLEKVEADARHQLNMQVLESETKVEQLELRIADLEPLQARLEAADRELAERQAQLERVSAEKERLESIEQELAERQAQLERVCAEKGRLELVERELAERQAQLERVSAEKEQLERQAAELAAQPATVAVFAAEEPVVQTATHVMSAAPPPAAPPAAYGFQFASSLFGAPSAAPAADLLDSFGLAPAAQPPPPPPAPPAVQKTPTLAEDIAEQLSLMRAENEQLRARLAELEPTADRCQQLEAEVGHLREELTGNERGEAAQLESAAAENASLWERISGMEQETAQLQSAAGENAALRECISGLEQESARLESAAAENVVLRERVSSLESEAARLESAAAESAALRERVSGLEGETAGLAVRLEAAEADKAALEAVIARLEAAAAQPAAAQPAAAEPATTEPAATEPAASPEIAELRRQLTEAEESRASLQAEKAAADAELEATKVQLQQYIDYCNYYAAYYAQGDQQADQGQAVNQNQEPTQTAQQYDMNLTDQQHAASQGQEQYQWPVDAAAAAQYDTAPPSVAVSELASQTGGSELSSVNLFSPAPSEEAAASDAAVADAVVSAAQSVIPSVLSFFGGVSSGGGAGGGGAASGEAQSGAQDRLEALRTENETLRARVSELELSVAADRAATADPLVALTSSPFLEEAGSPPLRAEWGWEEFTPSLEVATHPTEAAAPHELARVSAELLAEREKVARLEAAAAALWEQPALADPDQLANVVRELQTEREKMQRLQEEAEGLREQAAAAAAAEGQVNASREQASQLQQEVIALQLEVASLQQEVARLSNELEAERSRASGPLAPPAPPGADEVAQLSAQLAEELGTVSQLSGELESERADVARLEGEIQMLRDMLADAQVQLSAARSAPAADSALSDQAAFYRQKVTELETTLAAARDDLQQAKVKNGRLLQKLKVQQKAARGAAAGADALDAAMLEEVQAQAAEAGRRADEAERLARELQQEKARLSGQLETFQDAQERLVDAKERLDAEVHALRVENDRLRSQLSDMEWRLAELEEAAESREGAAAADAAPESGAGAEGTPMKTEPAVADEVARSEAVQLVQEKAALELRLTELELRNEELLELYQTATAVGADHQLQRAVEQLQLQLDAAAGENAALNERLAAYEAHWLAQSAGVVPASQPYHVDAATSPPLHLTGADPAAPADLAPPADLSASFATTLVSVAPAAYRSPLTEAGSAAPLAPETISSPHLTGADPAAPATRPTTPPLDPAALEEVVDQSPILRSREVIIHGMAEEISGLHATTAALRAEAAQWRTLAEEGEDGDVVDGLNEHLRQLVETLHSRDARCHELTSEVAQLLEERDMLQLRLSSALRSNQSRTTDLPQSSADETADVQQLKIKLAELKQLNYLLDIQLQDEVAERRRLQRSLQPESQQHGRHQMALSPNTSDLVSSSSKDI